MGFTPLLVSRLAPLAIFLALLIAPASTNTGGTKLREIYSWKSLDFDFPNELERENAILNKSFIPGYLMPIDVDVYYGGAHKSSSMVFVTIPRFQDGVPVTLGYVTSKKNSEGNPLIAPYPNWEMQQPGKNCMGITSVFRIVVDPCHRLWVLDTGKLDEVQVCPPQLLLFSLQTDRLLNRYVFPKDQYTEASLFITPVIDIRNTCDNAHVYIADVTGFSLIVYDHKNSRSWRIVNDLFKPDPNSGTFEINNQTFDLLDGLFGLAVGRAKTNGDKILYFHSLASRAESWVPTSVIRNYELFKDNAAAAPNCFKSFQHLRSSQSAAEAIDAHGVLFYSLLSEVGIGCWNSNRYKGFGGLSSPIVVMDRETLQFPSGMKVITPKTGNRQQLWVISISFQKIMAGTLDPNVTNFRIQAAEIEHLVRGTYCEFGDSHTSNKTLWSTREAANSLSATTAQRERLV